MGVLVLISKKVFASKSELTNAKNLVVGDSHAVMIGGKVKKAVVDSKIAHSGWNVSNLLTALSNYPISNNVGMVFISIGTNSGYNKNDKIESLISKLNQVFPNAELFVFKGSYGWSGKWENKNAEKDQVPYYQRFEDAGVTVLNSGLGYFSTDAQAHSTSSNQAKAIITEINYYIN
jgi:hypothetical protein